MATGARCEKERYIHVIYMLYICYFVIDTGENKTIALVSLYARLM